MRNERRCKEKLQLIQNRKLKRLIEHAFHNVPFYRDMFKKIGLKPGDITSIDDLHKIPIITKDDFHKHTNTYLMDKRIGKESELIPINTSGSSGVSLRFYIDHKYDQFRKAQYLRPYFTNGRKPRDRVIRFINTPSPNIKWFQRLGFFMEHNIYTSSDLEQQVAVIRNIAPTIIQGFGSILAMLGEKVREKGEPITYPRLIFTDSELLTDQTRDTISKAFKAKVIDIYGTFETDNIAYECDRRQGYHIAMDCVIMEFIRNGKPVPPGEVGEIVCTVLDNYTMPFIRYNLKDVGAYTEKPCSCGRSFPLMRMIDGRADDFAIYHNGEIKSPRTFLGLFDILAPFLFEYQIIQTEIDRFIVYIVPKHRFSEGIKNKIRENLWQEFPEADIIIKSVSAIRRDKSGKLRAFKSLVRQTRYSF